MGLHEKTTTISMNSSMKRRTACMKNLICGTCLNFSFSLRYECTTQRIVRIGSKPIYHKLSRDTMWHSQTSLCSLFLSLKIPNDVQSVAQHSKNIQAANKGSDETVHMCRLIRGFADYWKERERERERERETSACL